MNTNGKTRLNCYPWQQKIGLDAQRELFGSAPLIACVEGMLPNESRRNSFTLFKESKLHHLNNLDEQKGVPGGHAYRVEVKFPILNSLAATQQFARTAMDDIFTQLRKVPQPVTFISMEDICSSNKAIIENSTPILEDSLHALANHARKTTREQVHDFMY